MPEGSSQNDPSLSQSLPLLFLVFHIPKTGKKTTLRKPHSLFIQISKKLLPQFLNKLNCILKIISGTGTPLLPTSKVNSFRMIAMPLNIEDKLNRIGSFISFYDLY